MALSGSIQSAPSGLKGFDVDAPLSASAAQAFYAAGYRFVVRYVGRTQMASIDLTTAEAEAILGSGLGLMVVQHVLEPGWSPSGSLGTEYGANAARFAEQIGIPGGVNVWCDLEGVANGTPSQNAAEYCQNWYQQVSSAGYAPGLYVGYEPGLTNQELYDLSFQHYWGAYNVDASIPGRGWQIKQSVGTGGTIAGISTETYDDDRTMTDGEGGTALWLVA
jgi:hypothetical protein